MEAKSCEAATFAGVRDAWATLQTDPVSAFAEVTDNFVTNNADVAVVGDTVNGEFVLTVEGGSRVADVSQLFCLGQPSKNHGGALNQKGHGLKIFQAAFGADALVYVRRRTDGNGPPQHFLVRHGPRHDMGSHLNVETSPTIRMTYAAVDIRTGMIEDKSGDCRSVTVGLYTQNPFCTTDLVERNVLDVLAPFTKFPPTDDDHVMFVYWGFNAIDDRPKLTLRADGGIDINGKDLVDALSRKYLLYDQPGFHLNIPSIVINGAKLQGATHTADKFAMTPPVEYTLRVPGHEDIKYTMSGGWPKELVESPFPASMKFMNWPKCGALLHYYGRVLNDEPKEWMSLYDTTCSDDGKFGNAFHMLQRGGHVSACKKKAMDVFQSHLGADEGPDHAPHGGPVEPAHVDADGRL